MKFEEVDVDRHAENTEKVVRVFDSVQTEQQYDIAMRMCELWHKSVKELSPSVRSSYHSRICRATWEAFERTHK